MDNGTCNKHSGVCSELSHLTTSDVKQWESIDAIKNTLTKTLTAIVITLIVGIVNLITMLVKLY